MTAKEMRDNPPSGYRVYKYTFPDGMIYVGQTKRHLKMRYYDGYKNKRLMDAFQEYGWENTKKEILVDGLDKQSADKEEIRYIELLDACNPKVGYNISKGGNLGFLGLTHSQETKEKMSKSGTGKHSGENNWNYGRTRNKEEIEKFRESIRWLMKPVVQKSISGEKIREFESLSEAARQLNTTTRNIRFCIQGVSHTACGFLWEYKAGDSD